MISLDARYPGIVDLAEEAIQQTMPRTKAATVAWRDAFPRHGRGRKHEREIEHISVSHRKSVALMDEFIGPKC